MYEHLRFSREAPVNPKRSRPGFGSIAEPDNLQGHCNRLIDQVRQKRQEPTDIGGYDQRRLLRLTISNKQAIDLLGRIPGVEFVSQEEELVALAFATETALDEFEARLASLAGGDAPTYKQLLYAIESINSLKPEDRKGWALSREGLPGNSLLDVELLPIQDRDREQIDRSFFSWAESEGIQIRDSLIRPGLLLYRVSCDQRQLDLLLCHRDVRLVDLPPRLGLSPQTVMTGIQDIPAPVPPPEEAPRIAILDSGIQSNHPLLQAAIGDAQSFCEDDWVDDRAGHGTAVAGLTLYGNINASLQTGQFVPNFWILSGRILDGQNEYDNRLIENQVTEAIRAFVQDYGCKIFNLSIGDLNRPYEGRHLRGLAYTIDTLARELNVLIIVSSGNFYGTDSDEFHWREGYPGYLFENTARLIDPAPALNAVTVGSVAQYNASFQSQRNNGLEHQPIADIDLPSPFTRCGPSIGGAIKPDFVAYGGNYAYDPRVANDRPIERGLGILSLSNEVMTGRLFQEVHGSSFATPQVTHLAGRFQSMYPEASANLIRAFLGVNSRDRQQWSQHIGIQEERFRCVGYGVIEDDVLFRSTEESVTMYAEDYIANDTCHYYEIPVPSEFLAGKKRLREIIISLSYFPAMRTTRIDYNASQVEFRLIQAGDLNAVSQTFQAGSELKNIPEMTGAMVGSTLRSKGTLQCDRWKIKQESSKRLENKYFLLVTRKDRPWGEPLSQEFEPYALAVQLRDAENEEARHYANIRSMLSARVQARQRN